VPGRDEQSLADPPAFSNALVDTCGHSGNDKNINQRKGERDSINYIITEKNMLGDKCVMKRHRVKNYGYQ
jgi:hypothetical protein